MCFWVHCSSTTGIVNRNGGAKPEREGGRNRKGQICPLFFSRATTSNLVFVTKLWGIMETLHCSRLNVQKSHGISAVFVWPLKWARWRPTNLFRRIRDGGLGLAYFYIRQLVNRFLLFRDQREPFLRTVIQVRLARALRELVVLSSNMQVAFTDTLKRLACPPSF